MQLGVLDVTSCDSQVSADSDLWNSWELHQCIGRKIFSKNNDEHFLSDARSSKYLRLKDKQIKHFSLIQDSLGDTPSI